MPLLRRERRIRIGDVVHGRIEILDVSRRNRNFRVLVGDRGGLLVKQAGDPADAAWREVLASEAVLYRAFHDDPAFGGARWFVPRLLGSDARRGILVVDLVRPATTLTKFHLHGGRIAFPPAAGRTAGRILADVHVRGARAIRAGRLAHLPGRYPMALKIRGLPGAPRPATGPADRAFLELVSRDASFYDDAPRLVDAWEKHETLVHGDVRWDNFLLTSGAGPPGEMNLRLIDWELACRGDAAWDVACFLGEYLRFWLTTAGLRGIRGAEDVEGRAAFRLSRCARSARAFLAAYRARARRGRSVARDLDARAAAYVPFVLVQIGFEHLQRQERVPGVSRACVELAVEAARDPAGWCRERLGVGGLS